MLFQLGRRQGSCGKGVAWIIGEERTTTSEKDRSFAFYDRDHQYFSNKVHSDTYFCRFILDLEAFFVTKV